MPSQKKLGAVPVDARPNNCQGIKTPIGTLLPPPSLEPVGQTFHNCASFQEVITAVAAISATTDATTSAFSSTISITGWILLELVLK
eukprot:5731182-Ditylum_brightwellii.AAC.1